MEGFPLALDKKKERKKAKERKKNIYIRYLHKSVLVFSALGRKLYTNNQMRIIS